MIRTILIALCLLFIGPNSRACDCDKLTGINEADLVFTGTVFKIEDVSDTVVRVAISFYVDSVEKGDYKHSTVTVFENSIVEAACGVEFRLRHRYMVVTEKIGEHYWTHLCTKTREL